MKAPKAITAAQVQSLVATFGDTSKRIERPRVIAQGKTVIEQSDGEWLILHPDGMVSLQLTRAEAEECAKQWLIRNVPDDAIGVATIEWR